MKSALSIAALLLAASPLSAHANPVLDPDTGFDVRHKLCLEAIAEDAEAAFETAMTWVGRGGGHRARHCEAMALFTLGQEEEAGYRLDTLVAELPADGGREVEKLRRNYSVEAAQSWLQAGRLDHAWQSATTALEIEPAHAPARITRARIYFALDRIADAETDLTSVLAFHPEHAEALRFRADARLRQGELEDALEDAELSLSLEPTVETALIRGHIREAMSKQAMSEANTPDG